MDSEAQAIIGAIMDLDGPYDLEIQARLQHFLTPMKAAAAQQPQMAAPIVELLRHGSGTRNLAKHILVCSALADITGEAQWFDLLFDDAASPALDFDRRHTLFIHLQVSLFHNRAKIAEDVFLRLEQQRLRALFDQLVDEMEAALRRSSFATGPGRRTPGRVVILTPQFLHAPHATTLRTLEYAQSLLEDFGKTPVIVESHIFPKVSPFGFVPPFSSNRNPRLKALDEVDVMGRPVEFYKAESELFGLSDLVHTQALIAALEPELVIAIGTPFLPAEAAALRAPVFCQPTTASVPMVRRAKTFSWSAPSPALAAALARLGVEDPSLFHMPPGFSAPDEHPSVTREALGLPRDAFVFAVVGNRLHDDVGAGFLDVLEAITAEPRAHVAMMGQYDGFDDAMAARPKLMGRVSFLGFRRDILSALRACDVFLNPDRAGGGRSGVYAQLAGLPVLALKRGDVAAALGAERCLDSYAEMTARALDLMGDPAALASAQAEVQAHAGEGIGVKTLIGKILETVAVSRG